LKLIKGSLKIKSKRGTFETLPLLCLTVAAFLLLPYQSFCQEKKTVPDGTEGLILEKRKPDSISKKLAPNEFNGPYFNF